ncbi:MFS transporter [Stigmatella erecta]|uniref:Fucose permease n=1 Tax=Stigmatella erecta TaxID=83460 RepID=A0A1I0JFA9_9BACT|nr:MFS transporter [Stigmatella erecta]SEU08065.1 Fucose permease [Stigmatella erecta]
MKETANTADAAAPARHTPKGPIAGVLLAYGAWGVFWGAWGALLPGVKVATGASERELGLSLLGVAAGALPAMLLFGPWVDRLRNRALPLTLAAFAAAVVPLGLVTSPWALGIALVFVGATSGALDIALNARVAALEAAMGRKLFNMAHAAFPLAVVLASTGAGLGRQLELPLPLLIGLLALVVFLAVPANLEKLPVPDGGEGAPRNGTRGAPLLLTLGLLGAAVHLVENAVEQWSALYLETVLGAQPVLGGTGPAVYMGSLFVGRLIAQRLATKLDGRTQLSLAGISAAVGLVLVLTATHPLLALAGFAVAGLGMAGGIPTVFSMTTEATEPSARGAAIARVTLLAYFGYLASPPLCGAIAQAWGLRATWGMLAASGLVLALAAFALPRLQPRVAAS